MKITSTTTLGELAFERAKLGVFALIIDVAGTLAFTARVYHVELVGPVIGLGADEAEAIENAFTQLRAKIGAQLVAGVAS